MRAFLFPLVLLLFVGCGGSPTEEACREFVTYYSDLACTGELDIGVDCAQYRDYPCDRAEYFECLEGQFFCDDDGEYVDNGFGDCASLAGC